MPSRSLRAAGKRAVNLLPGMALALAALPAPAHEPDCHLSPPVVAARVRHVLDGPATLPLIGRPAEDFLARLNAVPPPTDFTGDEVLIFTVDGDQYAYIAIFQHRCLTDEGAVPADVIRYLEGEPS